MYENFVGTWETVRNREVSVLERCPHGEVRLSFVINLLNNKTIILLNLAEYRLILADSAYGLVG